MRARTLISRNGRIHGRYSDQAAILFALFDRLARVGDQVEKDLLQLNRVSVDAGSVRSEAGLTMDSRLVEAMYQQFQCALYQFVDVERRESRRLIAGEVQQLPDQAGDIVHLVADRDQLAVCSGRR